MFKILRDKTLLKNLSLVFLLVLLYYFFILGQITRLELNFPNFPTVKFLSKKGFFKLFKGPNLFKVAQLKTTDFLFYNRLSGFLKPKLTTLDNLVVITIDDDSFRALNKRWPWPRSIEAELIYKLKEYGAKVIGFDFAFVGESMDTEEDLKLSQAIKDAGNTLIVSYFDPQGKQVLPNRAFFLDRLGYGFINKPRDLDYLVRQARLVAYTKEKKIIDFSFEIKALCRYWGLTLDKVSYNGKRVSIRISPGTNINIPTTYGGFMPIVYAKQELNFKTVPFWQVLAAKTDPKIFKDKIVLVGLTSEVFHDIHHTPLGLLPGTFIIAHTLATIFRQEFIREIPAWINLLLLLLLVLGIALSTYRFSALKGLVVSLIVLYLFLATSAYLLLKQMFWMDYFSPLLAIVVTYLGVSLHKYIRLLIENSVLKTQAITDSLTGLFLRRYMELKLNSEFEKATKINANLSVVMVDVDHFKRINDTYGHQAGDAVLKNTAAIINSLSRKSDIPTRYGGEEFCIILPGTREEGASIYAERLRKTIEDSQIPYQDKIIKVTASFGIANFPNLSVKSAEELLKCADQALYQAKESGRNRLSIYSTGPK